VDRPLRSPLARQSGLVGNDAPTRGSGPPTQLTSRLLSESLGCGRVGQI
jgi:hypothetical protein